MKLQKEVFEKVKTSLKNAGISFIPTETHIIPIIIHYSLQTLIQIRFLQSRTNKATVNFFKESQIERSIQLIMNYQQLEKLQIRSLVVKQTIK